MPACYFFVQQEPGEDADPDDGVIRAMCVECHVTKFPQLGWFYDGLIGPWSVRCFHCNGLIHHYEEDKNEAGGEETATAL